MTTAAKFIAHYGVKGMRWGVRRRGGSSTTRTQFKKPPNKLSNAELNRRIKRLETEKRYNALNAADKSKGRQFTESVLESSGRTVAKTVATGAAIIAVKRVLDSSGGTAAKELAKRLG